MKPIMATLILLVAAVAVAQDAPSYEIYGAATFRHLASTPPSWNLLGLGSTYDGFEASFTYRPNSWFGYTVDGDMSLGNPDAFNLYTGPVVYFPKLGPLQVYVHGLVGFNHSWGDVSIPVYSLQAARSKGTIVGHLDPSFSTTNFSAAGGGGVDVNIGQHWGIRQQLDYVYYNPQGQHLSSIRYSAGPVFKW